MRESTLKSFTVIQKLGTGSFSSVYKVQRIDDQQYYAMKKVKIGEMREKEKENALNEVRILASTCHPNIVNYREAFFDDSSQTLCVVMELADGGDIQKKINKHLEARSFFTEGEIWQALIQMSRGLKILHEVNILHRDLKCANVFCTKDGRYKLGDLNVSKVAKRGMAQTQTGTPYYTSPEVWKDKPYDSKCDIWSLGCVIYQMAALKPPFRASNLKELYNKIQRGIFQRIPTFYSQDLQNIINNCLKINPASRPSASDILVNPKVMSKTPSSELNYQNNQETNKCSLLKTIQVPKNLRCLKQALPKAQYDTDRESNSNSRAISERKYERVSSSQNIEKPKIQIPRVITTPKVEESRKQDIKQDIKYALMRRPSSNSRQPKSQCRQLLNPVIPSRISRNNSVDSINKRPVSNHSRDSKEKRNICLDDITNRCRQIQERVKGIINKKKESIVPSPFVSQKRHGVHFPRVSSRERVVSASRQYESRQRQKSFEKQLEVVQQKSSQKHNKVDRSNDRPIECINRSLERQNSKKRYVYGVPPKIK